MKKIYAFTANIMNGRVTIKTVLQVCATKELAERARTAVEKANHGKTGEFGFYCSDVEEICLIESEEDSPLLRRMEDDKQ